ncbi:hypothetical protein BT67DRAFT_39918 [Trichocladium antarcticum]|uniref:Uncharacterized protein n=1 Tax=Trichocladium antarcticum TaxID=1450529 RepID=A0AAN6UL24_9PEZI|nr:hypothetical protein BT67DRAFT_39918 [Trichocladium antarcticum]
MAYYVALDASVLLPSYPRPCGHSQSQPQFSNAATATKTADSSRQAPSVIAIEARSRPGAMDLHTFATNQAVLLDATPGQPYLGCPGARFTGSVQRSSASCATQSLLVGSRGSLASAAVCLRVTVFAWLVGRCGMAGCFHGCPEGVSQ